MDKVKLFMKYISLLFFSLLIFLQAYSQTVPVTGESLKRSQRKYVGFTVGGGVTLGIGAGLIVAGMCIIQPKEDNKYQLGRSLVIAGISTATLAIPLFVFRGKCKDKIKSSTGAPAISSL
jgi:hypothetical protein